MEKKQRERLRKLYRTMNTHIHYLLYKIMWTPSFISRIEWRSMLEWLDPKEGERILDVACGPGQLSLKIAGKGCEVCGSDRSIILTVDSFTYPISDKLKEKHSEIAYVVNYYTPETLKERFKIAGFEMNRNKYLLNSRITSFFFNIGIKIKWSFYLWTAISFIVYPLCLVSERLFVDKNIGYTLAAEGKRRRGDNYD